VINVSGRLYPVEIRYRAVREEDDADDRTLMDAIVDAVGELALAGRATCWCFCPASVRSRGCRGAAQAPPAGTEMLPLYARLSVEEQERVFKPGGAPDRAGDQHRRDLAHGAWNGMWSIRPCAGEALQLSQQSRAAAGRTDIAAAAAQRAGRCGRVADGICNTFVREQDYGRRAPVHRSGDPALRPLAASSCR